MLGEEGAVMTTLDDVTKKKQVEQSAEQQAAVELVRLAQERGLSLTGPDGLLKQLTKTVLETALNEEMTEHLGYEKNDPPEAGTGNIRNGTRAKTVLTDTTGVVEMEVPRDRAGTFEPQIVKKRQRRLSGVDEVVLSLYAKGLTTGEISAHFAEIYGASVSKETISRITDKVIAEMNDWAVRPLDETYAAIFIDAIVVKVRDGQVGNRPFYAAIGVTLAGERDILGLWAGTGGEDAKFSDERAGSTAGRVRLGDRTLAGLPPVPLPLARPQVRRLPQPASQKESDHRRRPQTDRNHLARAGHRSPLSGTRRRLLHHPHRPREGNPPPRHEASSPRSHRDPRTRRLRANPHRSTRVRRVASPCPVTFDSRTSRQMTQTGSPKKFLAIESGEDGDLAANLTWVIHGGRSGWGVVKAKSALALRE